MKKTFKWLLIIFGGLIVLCIVLLLLIPLFVDIQKLKPEIEDRISQATGRPFVLKGKLDLSLFPWAGISLSDLHMGNPPGFEEKDFIAINNFEIRVKLIPLLFKDIQIKRFIVKEPRIVLITNTKGQTNWEGIGQTGTDIPVQTPPDEETTKKQSLSQGLPLKNLAVREFAITQGTVLWIDQTSNVKKEISDLSITLENVSLDQPIGVKILAVVDKWPLKLTGNIGPIGKDMGKGILPVDLSLQAIEQLDIAVKGHIENVIEEPEIDMAVKVEPFSLRKLLITLDPTFAIATSDPKVLDHLSLSTLVKGNSTKIGISEGRLQVDQSILTFSATAKEFSKPDVTFDIMLNEIDADRYLPPPKKATNKTEEGIKAPPQSKAQKTDYAPFRMVILNGVFHADKVKINNTTIEKLNLKISGKDGVFHLNPLTCDLYQGHLSAQGTVDVQKSAPQSAMTLQMKNIQLNPLLKNVANNDIPVGALNAKLDIKTTGDDMDSLKSSLNGYLQVDESQLTFTVAAKEFSKPDVTFDIKLNEIDVDRYFPPPEKATDNAKEEVKETPQSETKQTDYTPLRAVVLDGIFFADKIKIRNTTIEKLSLKISGKNGVFNLNPLTCDLYQGHLNTQGTFDFQKSAPQSAITLQTKNIQINPLLKNVLDKDILAGALNAQLDLKTTGDDPDTIQKTLSGNGEFLLQDGAIKGIDLAGMVRNVTMAFGLSEKVEEKPKTDFTELLMPFTIQNGIFNTTSTILVSPLLRLAAAGKANLPEETLDFINSSQ